MTNNKTTIEFVNHASVLISFDKIGILSDPWYSQNIFHNGWRLLYENENNYINQVLDKTSHIYLSHEHPDHFNPKFLLTENIKKKIIERNIVFLFQETKDKRVINFLKNQGFKFLEVSSKKKIGDSVEIQVMKHDFYDSSISIETPDIKVLNLNDCPLRSIKDIKKFKKVFGTFDVLLTQFSYAAWKGGEDEKIQRQKAAKEKLIDVYNQSKILECKSVIPFASYIYFSNKNNFYMNDEINTPATVIDYLKKHSIHSVIMKPGEKQILKELKQDKLSLDFWEEKYNFSNSKKKIDTYNLNSSLLELNKNFTEYQKKIYNKNSKLLIFLLNKLSFFGLFQNINIYFIDKAKNYEYSILSGLKEAKKSKYDISMHSESLFFIFKNEFGFDTLTVNGCFECSPKNFSKVSKTLAIGSLNAMGLNLNLSILLRLNIIILFFKKLIVFIRKLK
jgi:UDP-MurNAc hydroxylase